MRANADHPRACGANCQTLNIECGLDGSSPRMRGKLQHHRREERPRRIIPAHAGQTVCGARSIFAATDHPRACGANIFEMVASQPVSGSSPRMRGKPMIQRVHVDFPRIIPAHAGQTTADLTGAGTAADHPRACGANGRMSVRSSSPTGSSPRMRGKHRGERACADMLRIIPAHAGQTGGGAGSLNGRYGSSPRMRGKRTRPPSRWLAPRIIPAHAGQTRLFDGVPTSVPDHPRACGANNGYVSGYGPLDGSSPRMRGKLSHFKLLDVKLRIIPAHAGQTMSTRSLMTKHVDHPRACGANTYSPKIPQLSCGSSPRMRGKLS